MKSTESGTLVSFDLNLDAIDVELANREVKRAVGAALELGKVAMEFSRVERVPRYDKESRESDVEHSFMLLMVAVELIEGHFPGLDSGLAAKFCGVHDLPELITGDVPTFHVSDTMLNNKSQAEAKAMSMLERRLPPHTYSLLERYEEQIEPEARLVRFVDKLLPLIVDIHGPGKFVMKEDYDVENLEQYLIADELQKERCEQLFPEKSFLLIHKMREVLSAQFAEEFTS